MLKLVKKTKCESCPVFEIAQQVIRMNKELLKMRGLGKKENIKTETVIISPN